MASLLKQIVHYNKSVQCSSHQEDPRLGTNTSTQCVCNSLFAIVWSVIRNISFGMLLISRLYKFKT